MGRRIFSNGIPVSALILVVIEVCLGLLILPGCARLKIIVGNSTHSTLENVSVTGGVALGYAHWSGRLRPGEVRHIRITEHVGTNLRVRGSDAATGRAFEGLSNYASTDLSPAWIDPQKLCSLFIEEMACLDHILWSRLKQLITRLSDGS